jgi:nitrite reductase/ring-hydroxylating ferredoxin subunit/Fe-S cluster biogenesis protein NfuA
MNMIAMAAAAREGLADFARDIDRLEAIFAAWDDTQRVTAQAYRRAIEALNAEALRRLIRALKQDPACLAALKGALADEVVYAVLRRHGIVKPSLAERVEAALESVRPMLASHGGDVELIRLSPPALDLRFLGACDGCAASTLTFHAGVKAAVQDSCPEITEIRQVKGAGGRQTTAHFTSPFAPAGDWLQACAAAEIADGGARAAELQGRKILLARIGTNVTCFTNACAHLGLPLDAGEVRDGIITCPHHDFQYDLASGECLTAPEVALHPHAVRVVNGCVEVKLAT